MTSRGDETRRCHAAGHSCGSSRARTCLALSGNQRSSVARTCLARRGARALLRFVAPQRRIGPPERNQHALSMQSALLRDESDHLNAISMQSACNQRSSKTNRTTSAEYLAAGEPAISMQSACNRTTSAEYLAAGEPSHWPIHRRCSTMGIEMPHLMREKSEAIRRGQRRSDAKRVNQSQSESIRGNQCPHQRRCSW